MLLAVEAHRRQPDVASESALYAALVAQPAIRRYFDAALPPGEVVRSMTASAGLLALDLDGTVVLVDTATLRPTGVTIATGGRNNLAFNRAGDELATSTRTGEIRRWDPRSGREVAPALHVRPIPGNPTGPPIGYLADGALVVTDQAVVEIVPRGAGAPIRHVDVPGAPLLSTLAVSPSARTIAVGWVQGAGFGGGGLGFVDTSDLTFRAVPWSLGSPIMLRFGDDRQLYVSAVPADLTGHVALVDVETASLASQPVDLPAAAFDLITLRDGGALAVLFTGGLVRVRPDMTASPRIEVRGQIPLARLADGTVLAVVAKRLVEIDPDERSTIGSEVRAGGRTAIGLLGGSAGRLLLLGPGSHMTVVDATTLAPSVHRSSPHSTSQRAPVVSMSPDGAHVGVADAQGSR